MKKCATLRPRMYATIGVVLLLSFSSAGLSGPQLKASFSVPSLGYVYDSVHGQIRPVIGIPGSSRFGDAVAIEFALGQVSFLPGQAYALAGAPGDTDALLIGMESNPPSVKALPGVPSNVTRISVSPEGTAAAFYYALTRRIVIVNGLPASPVVAGSIDVSPMNDLVGSLAVDEEGAAAMLSFSGEENDVLYRWTPSGSLQAISPAARISAITFSGDDAIVADALAHEVFAVRDVRGSASRVWLAGKLDGISDPQGIAVSVRNEILVANAGNDTISVLASNGRPLRTRACTCTPAGLQPHGNSTFRLTNRLDAPVLLIDANSAADRIFFVPALRQPEPQAVASEP